MSLRVLTGAVAIAVALTGTVVTSPSSDGAVAAPGAPGRASEKADRGAKSTWTEADKAGFGTARSVKSAVWFTLQRGRISEVFYPDLSTPSVRSLELVVTDGRTFTDRQSTDMVTDVTRPDESSLRFTQVSTDESGRYRITQEFVTSPARSALVVHTRLESLDGARYRLFAIYDPALANTGMDDRGRSQGGVLVATDRQADVASALVARPAFTKTSNALLGRHDGWRDLRSDHRLDHRRGRAGPGNVVQTGLLGGVTGRAGHQQTTIVLGFKPRPSAAVRAARRTLATGYGQVADRYDEGWHEYVDSLRAVPASAAGVRREYLASVLVMSAAGDKQHQGAYVASPSAPWVWGDEIKDLSKPSGAYHLVWARDAYEFGTALWAAGDRRAARQIVKWLFWRQQKPNGSFPQNSDVSGKPVWTELQLDETALPVVLARLTGTDGKAIWPQVKRAADFIAGFRDPETGRRAPFTPQERWENQSGYSPNSIAAQISGLVCAAAIAEKHGDHASAERWLTLADRWQRKVQDWTVTTNGPLSDSPYFLRLTKDGRPNRGTTYEMGDGGPKSIDQRAVVDPSFLDLVRYGIEAPDDPAVLSTLEVVDRELEVTTPNGSFWRRFSQDGYGETRTGGEWRITEPGADKTLGRGWPLLTGERGEYAVTAGQDGSPYLATMAAAAGPGDMLAEQVWDGRPPTGRPCCPAGEGTRSATPLTWSHAQLVRLAWTIQLGHPVDQQALVAERYLR
jgi:glucoamylase